MAAAWLAQRDEGLTDSEEAEFTRWQQADPRHAAAVARLGKTWMTLQQLREFRPESRRHPDPDLLGRPRPAARVIRFPVAAVAGLAAALVIGAFFLFGPTPPARQDVPTALAATVYATTADGYQRVTLADGSVLELNANSEVRVDFLPVVRHVELKRGEAHFTVAKDPTRPFIVHAGQVAVRAVGTAFNVRFAGEGVEVLVTEGRVRVENAAGAVGLPELVTGQRLLVPALPGPGAASAPPEELTPASVHAALAWQGPRLRFNETPLAEVVAQFNRHNRVQIELGEASLAGLPVDGSFRSENVEAFIRLLESDASLRVERVGEHRIVLRRAP